MPAFNPLTLKLQELQRRQALADAMQQQALEPARGQVSGTPSYPIYVKPSPWESVAKVAQAAGSGLMTHRNDQRYNDIANEMKTARADSLKSLFGESNSSPTGSSGAMPSPGTPSSAGVPPAPISNLPPPLITAPGYTPPPPVATPPPTPQRSQSQMLSDAQNAIDNGADPEMVRNFVTSQLKPPGNEPNSVREYQFAKTNGFQGSFQDWVAAGGQSSRPSSVQEWEFYNKLPGAEQPRYLEMKRNPNMVVKDIGSVPTVIAPRVSGTATTPLSTIGREASGASAIKEAEARGGTMGKAQGDITGGIQTRGSNAIGTQSLLDIADPLIDVATGSTVGAGVDAVSKFFGKPTGGAEAISKLKVLQAGLMTSMPRMEGPQSDRDVQLYRDASGQIGDPTVPADIKKAALQTIRQIQQKYVERAAGGGVLGPTMPLGTIGGPNSYSRFQPPPSAGKTLVYDPATGTFK
jgi:hypothetical protein